MKILKTGGIKSFDEMPIEINWSLTKRCNYRCSYCFHYGKNKVPPPPETIFYTRTIENSSR